MANLREVMVALEATAEKVIKRLVLDVVANLVRAPSEGGTPVDTGWARANWVPSIGTPTGQPTGSREAVSAGAQRAGVASVATGYRLSNGRVYISNNVPYILRLNEGSSAQAPPGFIQNAIADAVGGIR